MRSLQERLKERKLVQWALAYLAGAWLVTQVLDVVEGPWGLSSSFVRVVQLLLAFGFLMTLVVAWYHGEKGRQRVSGSEVLMVGALLALFAFLVPIVWQPEPGPDPEREVPAASIAVLPFVNMSSDPEQEYFSDGLSEEVLNVLAQVSELHVTSRSSAFAFKGQAIEIPELAARLGVAHVLEGSVQKAGDRVRITAQLIEAETDRNLWSDQFDRDLLDIFAVQDEISAAIVAALVDKMGLQRAPAVRRSVAVSPDAYDAYLRGRQAFSQRTPEGFRSAVSLFGEAIRLAPGYAPAYAALAATYGVSVSYGIRDPEPYFAARQALAMADSALAYDPDQGEAHAARLYVLRYLWAPFDEVRGSADRAVELEPSSANVHGWYAHLLARDGQVDESIRQDERAIALDPLSPGRRLGFTWNALGGNQFDVALREANRALTLAPGHPMALAGRALALLMLGRAAECIDLDLGPYAGIRAMCLHELGDQSGAAAVIDSLVATASSISSAEYSSAIPLASITAYYAWIGDSAQALAWLRRSYEVSPETVLFWILDSDVYAAARQDPAFRDGLVSIRSNLH